MADYSALINEVLSEPQTRGEGLVPGWYTVRVTYAGPRVVTFEPVNMAEVLALKTYFSTQLGVGVIQAEVLDS